MLEQLSLATLMVVVTVLIHLFGLAILMRVLRSHTRIFRKLAIMPLTLLCRRRPGPSCPKSSERITAFES